jgi:putative drug exporter of the RND superfamily
MKQQGFERWGNYTGGPRSKWVVIGAWIALVLLLSLMLPQVNEVDNYTGSDLPESTMSMEASAILDEQFASDSGLPLLIVWYNEAGIPMSELEGIQALYAALQEDPLAEQKSIPPLSELPAQALMASLSENGKSLVTPVFFDPGIDTETLDSNFDLIRERTEAIMGSNPYDSAGLDGEGLQARFSGPSGISVDATRLFESADFQLMIATVLIILIILLAIYRSPILAIIPLLAVGLAYLVVSPLLGGMVERGWIAKDGQAISIMIVLLFGAGTDYCLFLIARYRDLLQAEANKYEALASAVRESIGAIVMSGLTVVIGLGALGLADYGAFQRFAVPFSLGILITGIAVITLLPAMLSVLGRAAFWPFVPRTPEMAEAHARKKNKPYKEPKANHRFMRAVGDYATNNPWRVIAATSIILVGLAIASSGIRYNYDLLSAFPDEMDSLEGFALIEENFTAGELAPVRLIVDTGGKDVDLSSQLAALPYVGAVGEVETGRSNPDYQLYEVDLKRNPYSNEAMDDVEQMKSDVTGLLADHDLSDTAFWIGGETSKQIDERNVQKADERRIQPVIILIIFLVLLLYLRAIVTSIQLMATVLVSFLAALGGGWLVITGILGHEAMSGTIPLYSFVFIIALGNDYNIFMISDIWKNRKRGLGHQASIAGGVASTGAVITSAGLILAGTFAVLASLPIQVLVQFGIVTAIGILLDTFIVRPLLVPALIMVLGKWSYWPGKLWKKPL